MNEEKKTQINTRLIVFFSLFLVWDAIMDGHPMMQSKKQPTTKAPIRQPTGLFERNPLFDGMDDDGTVAATAAPPSQAAAAAATAENPQIASFSKNDGNSQDQKATDDKVDYGMDMDTAYGNGYDEPSNQLPFATNVDYQFDLPAVNAPSNYLIGPMVVRVRPDGSPVDEDKSKPLPIDDDRDAMTAPSFFPPAAAAAGAAVAAPASKEPSTRLEAPAAPIARASPARFMPDEYSYTNYQTIVRPNSKSPQ